MSDMYCDEDAFAPVSSPVALDEMKKLAHETVGKGHNVIIQRIMVDDDPLVIAKLKTPQEVNDYWAKHSPY